MTRNYLSTNCTAKMQHLGDVLLSDHNGMKICIQAWNIITYMTQYLHFFLLTPFSQIDEWLNMKVVILRVVLQEQLCWALQECLLNAKRMIHAAAAALLAGLGPASSLGRGWSMSSCLQHSLIIQVTGMGRGEVMGQGCPGRKMCRLSTHQLLMRPWWCKGKEQQKPLERLPWL